MAFYHYSLKMVLHSVKKNNLHSGTSSDVPDMSEGRTFKEGLP